MARAEWFEDLDSLALFATIKRGNYLHEPESRVSKFRDEEIDTCAG